SGRRHTRWPRDWSSDVCSSDLGGRGGQQAAANATADRGWKENGCEPLQAARVEGARSSTSSVCSARETLGATRASGTPLPGNRRSEERRVGNEWEPGRYAANC